MPQFCLVILANTWRVQQHSSTYIDSWQICNLHQFVICRFSSSLVYNNPYDPYDIHCFLWARELNRTSCKGSDLHHFASMVGIKMAELRAAGPGHRIIGPMILNRWIEPRICPEWTLQMCRIWNGFPNLWVLAWDHGLPKVSVGDTRWQFLCKRSRWKPLNHWKTVGRGIITSSLCISQILTQTNLTWGFQWTMDLTWQLWKTCKKYRGMMFWNHWRFGVGP